MDSDFGFVIDDDTLLSFTNLDYCIYNAVVRSGPSLKDMRVTDLANAAGVSNATVVRFCKKCGYAGFPDLKAAYLEQLHVGTGSKYLPTLADDLQLILSTNDTKDFDRQIRHAFELLRWAHVMYIVGYGRSAGLARYAAHLYNSLGIFTLPIVEYPSLFHRAHIPSGSDVASLILSYSGTTPMALSVANDFLSCEIPIVAITTHPDSPLAKLSDVCISYELPFCRSPQATMLDTCLPAVAAVEQIARLIYNVDFADENATH